MIGKYKHRLNIQVLQSRKERWLVWGQNIFKHNKKTCNGYILSVNCVDFFLNQKSIETYYNDTLNNPIVRFSEKIKKKIVLPIEKHESFRNLTINEYRQFSILLKAYGYQYNKLKDEFIKLK